ncbi:bifunctional UDP-N-acetylglucosamine diphosphorylase/glucosamine-1-phosphate N-acetyltransferase GlmU [Xylocopilactobacillus apicola]|uniref:Bifunctional protein GlmU n=1 Tax=Xylocopilactobacillus apicola TaxID=2932184 RepID=A0AAU9DEU6_9LACO|nr:bifunctional UDP-N-acetylglucosamine diphosphorylase/glucosamine-1-phosphate N-acetyltransferase GlmU [Xylocopilactobacillus apicola]BDR58440.1 bifunctional protein GlmU [Xylocopilactobacillus apicola]
MENKVNVIILAAGKGTRMKSSIHKVMHEICHRPLIDWVLDGVCDFDPAQIYTVVGHDRDQVESHLQDRCQLVVEEKQLGTADAVKAVRRSLAGKPGVTLVLNGDSPLLTKETIDHLIDFHLKSKSPLTLLTADLDDPAGYGRIIYDQNHKFIRIVEQKDANKEELAIKEVNSGVYCFDNQLLFDYLDQVQNHNSQKEYYLTDLVEIFRNNGFGPKTYKTQDPNEILGVNDLLALNVANRIIQKRINTKLLVEGVQIIDPDHTYIDRDVEIGRDTIIEPNVQLIGKTKIGNNCRIGMSSEIRNSIIHDGVTVTSSLIEDSQMMDRSDIGPNSHLRPNSVIGQGVHIGNFCEIKNAKIGTNTKVGHLSYVGDADLGEEINVGCGVVFVNYDGVNKHRSTIGSYTFLGSASNIVAPVTISDHSFIAAGSTITEDVPFHALAFGRARQVNKSDYWDKLPLANSAFWSDDKKSTK